MMRRISKALLHALRRPTAEQSGSIIVEFALIVPILIGLYFGAVELSNALTANRRVANVASTAADLVGRVKTVSCTELNDILEAATAIMVPFPTTGLSIRLSSVVADAQNVGKVDWSVGKNAAPRNTGSVYPTPTGLTQANSSVIVAEVTYNYTPLLGARVTGPLTFSNTFYIRPRLSSKVTRTC